MSRTTSSAPQLALVSPESWDRARDVTVWALIVAAALVVGRLVSSGDGVLMVAALGAAALWRWPTAGLAAAITLCQEIPTSYGFGSVYPELAFGRSLYFSDLGGVSPVEVAVGLAFAATAARGLRSGKLAVHLPPAFGLLVIAGVAVCVLGWLQGGAPLLSMVVHVASPYWVCAMAVVVAASTSDQPGGWRGVCIVGSCALSATAVLGVFRGISAGATESGNLTFFYDSALPAAAAAVGLALVLQNRWSPARLAVLLTCLVLVGASGRRAVWLALALVAVVAVLARGRRLESALRMVAFLAMVAAATRILVPGVWFDVGARVAVAYEAVLGRTSDSSVEGHVSDIVVGLQYAREAPVLGYGVFSPSLPGLNLSGGSVLYVHNDLILQWLKLGVVGAVLLALLLLGMSALAWRRRAQSDPLGLAAVLFLAMVPICAMTAAFTTTTLRWPVLIGLAVGAVVSGPVAPTRAVLDLSTESLGGKVRHRL